jgi:hypothetical protein
VTARLFHISGWSALASARIGDRFVLHPGLQGAEGRGVYFAEGVPPRGTTAEGTRGGATAVVTIEAEDAAGWWRTKPSLARKHQRPRTWHTDGKALACVVQRVGSVWVEGHGDLPLLACDWSFSCEMPRRNPTRRAALAPLSDEEMLERRRREQAIERAVVRALDPHDPRLGLKPEYRRRHAAGCDPATGFCSVAVEAMWAMLGGNAAGYERRQIRHEGGSHWFLADVVGGRWIDPTRSQFATPVPYEKGRGCGLSVTRKAGVLYRGDPTLLISNKAAHLIALATGRALQRNPSKRVVVRRCHRSPR